MIDHNTTSPQLVDIQTLKLSPTSCGFLAQQIDIVEKAKSKAPFDTHTCNRSFQR